MHSERRETTRRQVSNQLSDEERQAVAQSILMRCGRDFRQKGDVEDVLLAVVVAVDAGLAIPNWAAVAQARINEALLEIRNSAKPGQRAKEAAAYKVLGFHKVSSRKHDDAFELYLDGQEVDRYRSQNRSKSGRLKRLPEVYAELEGSWGNGHPTWTELKKGHQYFARVRRKQRARRE